MWYVLIMYSEMFCSDAVVEATCEGMGKMRVMGAVRVGNQNVSTVRSDTAAAVVKLLLWLPTFVVASAVVVTWLSSCNR
jgi:hypothetical protein